jgi:hypothetical protein
MFKVHSLWHYQMGNLFCLLQNLELCQGTLEIDHLFVFFFLKSSLCQLSVPFVHDSGTILSIWSVWNYSVYFAYSTILSILSIISLYSLESTFCLLCQFQSSKLQPLTQNPFKFPLHTSSSPSHCFDRGFELSLELWNFGTPQFYVSSCTLHSSICLFVLNPFYVYSVSSRVPNFSP